MKRLSHGACTAVIPADAQRIPGRLQPLMAVGRAALQCSGLEYIKLQFHDEEPEEQCLSFDARENDQGMLLIPDPYCLASNGFHDIFKNFNDHPLPPWSERKERLFWRGATTGGKALTPSRIKYLPRYQLCAHTTKLPNWIDARFTDIVQYRDDEAGKSILTSLRDKQLFSDRVSPRVFGNHKWVIDIDGNVNSWGLIWKLFSGSCVLRVASTRKQWFHHRLKPYHHFVPIDTDMQNLETQFEWCIKNLDTCEAIANAGRMLAMNVVAEQGLDIVNALQHWKSHRKITG